MEDVEKERLKAYLAGELTASERIAFEQQCLTMGYDLQILIEMLEFEVDSSNSSTTFDKHKAYERLKFKLYQ